MKIINIRPMQALKHVQAGKIAGLITFLLGISLSVALTPLPAHAASPITGFEYDANGNLTKATDGLSNATTQQYDAVDRLIEQSQPHPDTPNTQLGTTTTQYNASDEVTGVTDPRELSTTYTRNAYGDVLTQTSPDTGITLNTYDNAGNLITRTDARGTLVSYTYDNMNRLTNQVYGTNGTVSFAYDQGSNGKGHLTQMTDPSGITRWTYDQHGRTTSKTFTLGTLSFVTRYGYDANGTLNTLTYPSGKVLQLTYNNGLVSALASNGSPLLSGILYQPFGPAAEWTFGNGIKTTRNFDLDGRLEAYDLGGRSRQLSYDSAGRLTGYKDTDLNHDQTFSYDGLSRLTGFTAPTTDISYSYDLNGNRTSKVISGNSEEASLDIDSNRLLGITKNSSPLKTYQYDASGNIINDGSHQFTYDGRGRLSKAAGSFGEEQYRVNGLGQRVAKVKGNGIDMAGDADQDGSLTAIDLRLIVLMTQGSKPVNLAADCNHDGKITTADASCTQAKMADMRINPNKYVQVGTYFIYDEAGHLLGEYNQNGTPIQETVWLGDMPVAVMSGSNHYYVYTDHLNTPRAIADGMGKVVWRWDSEAFGTTLANEDPDKDGKAFVYNLRFPGQYYDQATGLHYNGFRDYDPAIGRYIESDPIGLAGGINTFGYVGGNPVSGIDPEGLKVKGKTKGKSKKNKSNRNKKNNNDGPDQADNSINTRDALEEMAEATGVDLSLYYKICIKAECINKCGEKYIVDAWIPSNPTLNTMKPNCTCTESVWPRTPNFFDNPNYYR